MLQNDLLHTLALLKTEGIGDVIAKRLLHHLGSAEAIFHAKPNQLAKIEGIGASLLKNIKKSFFNFSKYFLSNCNFRKIEKFSIEMELFGFPIGPWSHKLIKIRKNPFIEHTYLLICFTKLVLFLFRLTFESIKI